MTHHLIKKENFSIEFTLQDTLISSFKVTPWTRTLDIYFNNTSVENLPQFDTSVLNEDEYPIFEALLEFFFDYIGYNFSNAVCLCLPQENLKELALEDFLKYQKIFECSSCDSFIRKFLKKDSFVCTCFRKTQGEILDFILEHDCFNVDSLKEEFLVGSSCGKCINSLKNIFTHEFYIQSKPKVFWIKTLEETLRNFFFKSHYSYQIMSFYKNEILIKIYPAFPVEERLLVSLKAALPFNAQFFLEYSQAE